jgi:hypothetical protein
MKVEGPFSASDNVQPGGSTHLPVSWRWSNMQTSPLLLALSQAMDVVRRECESKQPFCLRNNEAKSALLARPRWWGVGELPNEEDTPVLSRRIGRNS